jgi:hypothetical protein
MDMTANLENGGRLRWIKRERLGRKLATVAAVLALVLACAVAASGSRTGILFGVAIGAATAVAIFGDTRGTCSPSFLRRKE